MAARLATAVPHSISTFVSVKPLVIVKATLGKFPAVLVAPKWVF